MKIALVLAGGRGSRLGAKIPKQYIEVCGNPVISYCMNQLTWHKEIDGIQIVAQAQWREFICEKMCAGWAGRKFKEKFKGFSEPGKNRQLSILQGLRDILLYADGESVVLIHDGARPCVTEELVSACFDAVETGGHEGAVPVLPMKDTVYYSGDGKRITSLLERGRIFAGQSPEAFRLGLYYEANCLLLPEKILEVSGSAEPAVMAGMDIVMIPGDENNFKITTTADLERFRGMMGKGQKA